MTTRLRPTATTANLDLYVSDVHGSDSNSGLSPAAALKTVTAAVSRIPDCIFHRTIVHIGVHGGAGYVPPTMLGRELRQNVWFYGDGAGQAGEDGFVVQLGPAAAAAGSSANVLVTGGGLGVNAYLGMTIEILTGAAAGDRRTIRDNTATNITPTIPFSAAVAAGNSYRVVTPSVVWVVPAAVGGVDFVMVEDCGSGASDASGQLPFVPGLYLCNLQMTAAASTTGFVVSGSRVIMVGVDCPTAVASTSVPKPLWRASEMGLGYDVSEAGASGSVGVLGAVTDLGVASVTKWRGWGLAYRAAATNNLAIATPWIGTIVCPGLTVGVSSPVVLFGGNFFGPGSAGTAVLSIVAGGRVNMLAANTPAPAILISSTTAQPALHANGGTFTLFTGVLTLSNTGGPAMGARVGGYINAGGTGAVTGSGSTFGAIAISEGRILFQGTVGVTGTTGDMTVDGGVTTFAAATLGASGDALSNLNGSLIARA